MSLLGFNKPVYVKHATSPICLFELSYHETDVFEAQSRNFPAVNKNQGFGLMNVYDMTEYRMDMQMQSNFKPPRKACTYRAHDR